MKKFIIAIVVGLLVTSCSGYKYTSMPGLEFEDIDYGYAVKKSTGSPTVAYIDVGSGEKTLVLVHGLAIKYGYRSEVITKL